MATKTITGVLPGYDGSTALTALVFAENGSTVLNGSGSTVTMGSYDTFSFTVTQALAGYYDVLLVKTTGGASYSTRGKVYIPGDIAGTYRIESFYELNSAAFNEQIYPPVERSEDDTKAIGFYWMYASGTLTGTKRIDNGSTAALTGAISYVGAVGSKFLYSLAYNAADRPSGEGSVLYTITDGTNTRYFTLQVSARGSSVTVVPVTGVVEERVTGTTINAFKGETATFSIPCVDAEGVAVSLTGLTLTIYFDLMDGTDVVTVANADITKSGSTFTFTMPSAVTATACKKKWALRKSTGNTVLMHGIVTVTDVPYTGA